MVAHGCGNATTTPRTCAQRHPPQQAEFRPQRTREDHRRGRCCPNMYQAQLHAMRSFTRDKSVTQQRLSRGIVRRIASYARPYRLDLVIFLTLTALSAVIAVAVPLLLQRIIDDGILPKDTSVVLWIAGVVAALALAGAALSVATRWFSARIGEGLIYDLRT